MKLKKKNKKKTKKIGTFDLNQVIDSRNVHLYLYVYKYSWKECYITVISMTWFL